MAENAPFSPGLSPIMGKPVQLAFDGGRLTSDAGILVLAEIEKRLRIADRLAACLDDPRSPDRVRHGLAEVIRLRMLLIAAGYEDANDCDGLRTDPAFKMAVGRPPEGGAEVLLVVRHVVGAIRRRWPKVEIAVRGDSHHARHEAMAWRARHRVGYIFGLAARVTEMANRIKVALTSTFPYQGTMALLVERAAKRPP